MENPLLLDWYGRIVWGKRNYWKLLLAWGVYGGIWLGFFRVNDLMGLVWAFSFIGGWIIWVVRFMD